MAKGDARAMLRGRSSLFAHGCTTCACFSRNHLIKKDNFTREKVSCDHAELLDGGPAPGDASIKL